MLEAQYQTISKKSQVMDRYKQVCGFVNKRQTQRILPTALNSIFEFFL